MTENKFRPNVDIGKLLTTKFALEFYLRYVFDYMPTKIDEQNKIHSLSKNQSNLYSYYLVEGQVVNGGFVQVFYNGYGKYLKNAIQALTDIGQIECANILRNAGETGSRKILSFIIARFKGLFSSNLYEENGSLDKLDDEFYTYTHENDRLFREYIWKNRLDFMSEESYSDLLKQDITVINHDNGQLYQKYSLKQYGIEGWYEQYNTEGSIVFRKQFIKGIPTGASEEFHENGNLSLTTNLEDSKLIKIEYDLEGIKKSLRTLDYISDKADGLHMSWFNNGKVRHQEYSKGYLGYGKKEHFYENGQIQMLGTMKGYNFTLKDFYLSDGTQILKNGSGFTKYISIVDEGEKIRTDEYKNGVRDGESKTYINGELVSIERFEAGSQVRK